MAGATQWLEQVTAVERRGEFLSAVDLAKRGLEEHPSGAALLPQSGVGERSDLLHRAFQARAGPDHHLIDPCRPFNPGLVVSHLNQHRSTSRLKLQQLIHRSPKAPQEPARQFGLSRLKDAPPTQHTMSQQHTGPEFALHRLHQSSQLSPYDQGRTPLLA
jgi:hypothetical protein